MMRLNIPVLYEEEKKEGTEEMKRVKRISFNATLFALVKCNLKIGCQGISDD